MNRDFQEELAARTRQIEAVLAKYLPTAKGYQKTVDKKQYIFRSDGVEFKPNHPEPYIQKGQSKNWLKKAVDVFEVGTDELLGTFESVTAAANFIGCKTSNVTQNCKSRLKYKHQATIYKKYYCKYHYE